MAPAHVALLRGINVGGKNLISMRDLTSLFTGLGCTGVKTLLQSGNVVFRADAKVSRQLGELVPRRIAERLGLTVPVVLRTAAELDQVVRANPFLAAGDDPDVLHVMFLREKPALAAVKGLDPKRSPPDSFTVVGREVYLRCPLGIGRTKLSNAWFDSALETVGTARNWRTVMKLQALASQP